MSMDPKELTKNLSEDQLIKVKEYQKIHSRLQLLKSQMEQIQEETDNLIKRLDAMRLQENKNKNNG